MSLANADPSKQIRLQPCLAHALKSFCDFQLLQPCMASTLDRLPYKCWKTTFKFTCLQPFVAHVPCGAPVGFSFLTFSLVWLMQGTLLQCYSAICGSFMENLQKLQPPSFSWQRLPTCYVFCSRFLVAFCCHNLVKSTTRDDSFLSNQTYECKEDFRTKQYLKYKRRSFWPSFLNLLQWQNGVFRMFWRSWRI